MSRVPFDLVLKLPKDFWSESRVCLLPIPYKQSKISPEGRWWRDRLHSAATGLIFESGSSRLSVNTHFAKAFAQLHGRELQLAECVYSKKKPAQWVCYTKGKWNE